MENRGFAARTLSENALAHFLLFNKLTANDEFEKNNLEGTMDQTRIDRLNVLAEKEQNGGALNPQEREEIRLLRMEQMSELVMGFDDDEEDEG